MTGSEPAEAGIDKNLERLRIANHASGAGVLDYDIETGMVHCDEITCQLWGVSSGSTMTYDLFMSRLYVEAQESVQAALARAFDPTQDGKYTAEYRILHWIDGATRWITASGRVIFDQGRPVRLVALLQDITERKKQEAALRESEEKYRTLFALFSQGFCICEMLVDENGRPYDYRFLEVNHLFEEYTGLKDVVGKTAMTLLPDLEPYWVETYGKVAMTGEPLRFEQGSLVMGRFFDVYAFRFGLPQNLKFAIVFNDISVRKSAEERSQMLQVLASSLSTVLNQQEIAETIIQQGINGLGAAGGVVALLSDDKTHLEIIGSAGYNPTIMEKWTRIPIDHPTLPIALAYREQRRLWLGNVQERNEALAVTPDLLQGEQHQAWAAIPFNIDGDVHGVIGIGFNAERAFDTSEQTFLITLTEYCAQALHRAKLTERIALTAAAKERQRISRELHDSVKQLLFASSTVASSLPKVWDKDPEKAKRYTDEVIHLNHAALAELQSLLLEMRPEAIVSTPFMTLVRNLCNALSGHRPIKTEIKYEGPEDLRLPSDIHLALYRLVQETLNNVNKHSEATLLEINCYYSEDVFRITIRDNGKGFDSKRITSGFGMNMMRERAEAVGATLHASSVIGEGSTVVIEKRLG